MTLYLLQRKDMPGIYHRRISASTREPITTSYLEEAYLSRSLEEMIDCAKEYSNYEVCSVEVSHPIPVAPNDKKPLQQLSL